MKAYNTLNHRHVLKRLIAFFLLTALVLTAAPAVLAENEAMLFFDAAEELLFETGNATLTGEAEFALDGSRFKTAEVRYVQDYENSLFELRLRTPRRDGKEGPDRESGYTVVANGEDLYVTEVIYPGRYKTGSTGVQSTILRKSVQMDLMAELAKGLAEQADKLAGEGTVTVQTDDRGGKELQIKLGNDVPETVNTALNLFYQFIAKRYFNTDYDRINERYMVPMANYLTVTEGILSTTKSVTLRQADLTAKLDSAGKLEQVTGEMTVCLHTGRDGERELSISFRLNVSDEGSSKVEYFDPAAIQ